MNGACIFLRLYPGAHNFMATAQAAEPKIRPGAQDKPPLFPAGVGLFHGKNISDLNIHSCLLSYSALTRRKVI